MNGKAHCLTSVVLSVPSAIVSSIVAQNPTRGLRIGIGCLVGILLTPDLDQEGTSRSEWKLVKIFGPIPIGHLWMALWQPYAWAIPHRSPWSHIPAFGTALRMIYICIIVGVVTSILGLPLFALLSHPAFWEIVWDFFIGLTISDTAHLVMDTLT